MLDLYLGRRGGAVLSWGVGRSPPRPTVSVLVLDRDDVRAGREPPTAHQTMTGLQRLPNTVTCTYRRRHVSALAWRPSRSPGPMASLPCLTLLASRILPICWAVDVAS